jgi:hypothetical protein
MVYFPSPERCAIFYSECDFDGIELFRVCENTPQNKGIVVAYLNELVVKSFRVT